MPDNLKEQFEWLYCLSRIIILIRFLDFISWKNKLQVELWLLCQDKISALYVVFVLWSCTLHISKTWFPFFFSLFKFYDFLLFSCTFLEFGGQETIWHGLFPVGLEYSFSKCLLHLEIRKQIAKPIPHLMMWELPKDPTAGWAARWAPSTTQGNTHSARGKPGRGLGSQTGVCFLLKLLYFCSCATECLRRSAGRGAGPAVAARWQRALAERPLSRALPGGERAAHGAQPGVAAAHGHKRKTRYKT